MSENSLPMWDAYLSIAGEVNKVTELIGAGLTVAARLNYRVMSTVVSISTRLIQLMLLLIAKTHDLISLLRDDFILFLSDVGSAVQVLLQFMHDASCFFYNQHWYLLLSVVTTASLFVLLRLCHECGLLKVAWTVASGIKICICCASKIVHKATLLMARYTALVLQDVARCVAILIQILVGYSAILAERTLNVFVDAVSVFYFVLMLLFNVCKFRLIFIIQTMLQFALQAFMFLYVPLFVRNICIKIATFFTDFHHYINNWSNSTSFVSTLPHNLEAEALADVDQHLYNVRPTASRRGTHLSALQRRINRDITGLDLPAVEAYLQRRTSLDRRNGLNYEYRLLETERGDVAVTALPRPTTAATRTSHVNAMSTSFFNAGLKRVQGALGLAKNGIIGTEEANCTNLPECVVCQDLSRDVLLLPCRHLCLCKRCCQAIRRDNNACPMCRAGISAVHEVFA